MVLRLAILVAGLLVLLNRPSLPLATLCALAGGLALCGALWAWRCRVLPRQRLTRGAVLAPGLVPVLALVAVATLVSALQAHRWQQRLLPEDCIRRPLAVSGRVAGLVEEWASPGGALYGVQVRVERLTPLRCAGPRRIRLALAPGSAREAAWLAGLRGGDRVSVDARLRRPWGQVNPRARRGEARAFIEGLHALGSGALQAPPQRAAAGFGLAAIDGRREALAAWLDAHARHGTGRFLRALAVADRRAMTARDWTLLRRFGLTHLWVISGMHISLVAAPGWYLGRALQRVLALSRRAPRGLALLPVLTALIPAAAYAALAGFSLPTQRALLMLSLSLLGLSAGRRVAPLRIWALVGTALLLADPASLLGPSVWLSLGAVGLLLWCHVCSGQRAGVALFVRVQAFLLVAMIPLGLYWFQSAATIGAAINLIAVPLVSMLVLPLLLLALLLAALAEPLALLLLGLAEWPLALLWRLLEATDPFLDAFGSPLALPHTAALALLFPLLLAALLPRFPGKWRLGALLALPLLGPASAPADDAVRVRFFDVGQGTAVLVSHRARRLLYDTGPGYPGRVPIAERTLRPSLLAEHSRRLDFLVISHPDRDHDGGEASISAIAPPQITLRGRAPSAHFGPHIPAALRTPDLRGRAPSAPLEAGTRDEALCRSGALYRLGPALRVRILSSARSGDSDNNASCVLAVEAFGRRLLFPGDVDRDRERALVAFWGDGLRADVLMAGHHGSATSSSRLWLKHVRPRYVVVSAARDNRFGHPAPAVLAAVRSVGAQLLNTAWRGAIEFEIHPDGRLVCFSYRHRAAPFWRRGPFPRQCDFAEPGSSAG